MTADKRNAAVVIALILSLTAGARLLLWLEPHKPRWQPAPLLMAERGTPVGIAHVEITYLASRAAAEEFKNAGQGSPDSICVVYADEEPYWRPQGPRVQLGVAGSDDETLGDWQKRTLLAALGSLIQPSGVDGVLVRLAPGSDARQNPTLPAQASDLRELLERKRILQE